MKNKSVNGIKESVWTLSEYTLYMLKERGFKNPKVFIWTPKAKLALAPHNNKNQAPVVLVEVNNQADERLLHEATWTYHQLDSDGFHAWWGPNPYSIWFQKPDFAIESVKRALTLLPGLDDNERVHLNTDLPFEDATIEFSPINIWLQALQKEIPFNFLKDLAGKHGRSFHCDDRKDCLRRIYGRKIVFPS